MTDRDASEVPRAPESTAILLSLVRSGDAAARERLCRRYLPMLRAWAHGRLPPRARGLADTDDLAQIVLMRALAAIDRFEPRREGAFVAYLRRALLNAVRDELRRSVRQPAGEVDPESIAHPSPSALEQAIGREMLERYEESLARLPEENREAVILRLEFDYAYAEIAAALDRPSADAARMLVTRSLLRLAEDMREHRGD
ncbi:MAG TPA: sigma-70 family RNA polymerase sigma factor [Candidatus Udaeobacter sp.]|jgi:RNA polymerase sigma-70 factor (ECF subfamily)|nr:sigma-70 family RNA polymerase sigma factor [Candidatus Udaeobacter sp.]